MAAPLDAAEVQFNTRGPWDERAEPAIRHGLLECVLVRHAREERILFAEVLGERARVMRKGVAVRQTICSSSFAAVHAEMKRPYIESPRRGP